MALELFYAGGTGDQAPEPAGVPFDVSAYNQLVFAHNPGATLAHQTPHALDKLERAGERHGLAVNAIETSPHLADNIAALQETVTPDTLLAIRTGDGGLGKMLQAMRAAELDNPVLAMKGGRKNDIVRQLFNRHYRAHPDQALEVARVHEVRPILATMQLEDGGTITEDAWGYISAGITGDVAAHVNSKPYKEARKGDTPTQHFVAERMLAAKRFIGGKPFLTIDSHDHVRKVVDIIASNGSLMAGTMHLPEDMLTPGFGLLEIRNKLKGAVILGALMAHIPAGEHIGPEEAVRFALDPHKGSEIHVQVNGEDVRLLGRTVLQLEVAPSGVNMLATNSPRRR